MHVSHQCSFWFVVLTTCPKTYRIKVRTPLSVQYQKFSNELDQTEHIQATWKAKHATWRWNNFVSFWRASPSYSQPDFLVRSDQKSPINTALDAHVIKAIAFKNGRHVLYFPGLKIGWSEVFWLNATQHHGSWFSDAITKITANTH